MLKSSLKIASIFLFVAIVLYVFNALNLPEDAYADMIQKHIMEEGFKGIVLFTLICGILTCFGFPRQLLAVLAGYAFGASWGALYVNIGSLIGCILAFTYGRLLAQKLVQKHFSSKIVKIENFLLSNTIAMTIVIRLLPIGGNIVTNLVSGTTRIKAKDFFIGSFIGYIPQNYIFALLGSGVQLDSDMRMIMSGALFLFATLLGYYLYKKYYRPLNEIDIIEDDLNIDKTIN